MGENTATGRLRAWSVARWSIVGLLAAVAGVSGWHFTIFDVYGLDDFQGSLETSVFTLPMGLLLVVLDFRTAAQRSVPWAWLVLRAIAVPMLGIGIGSVTRVWLVTAGSGERAYELVEPHASDFAWQLMVLGAMLLAVQPLIVGVRRIAVALFGAPRAVAPASEDPEAGLGRSAGAAAPKWPGSTRVKAVAGVVAFALIASFVLVAAGRVFWHIGVETASDVQPMVATGAVDGREIAVVGYDELVFSGLFRHERVAAYDLATGELVWDRKLQDDREIPVSVDVVQLDERGAFVRMDHPSDASTWFVLDPRTGRTEFMAEESDLHVVDEPENAAPGIPGDAVERYIERDQLVPDEGYDYEFTDDADLERVFRYEDESLLINPATGRPAGEDRGFTLHGICCSPTALEARAEDGKVLWRRDDAAPSPRDVVAETESGRVVVLIEGPESKMQLLSMSSSGIAEAVLGDRGWLPW